MTLIRKVYKIVEDRMGYRTTFVSEDTGLDIPDWFVEKYKDWVNIGEYLPYSKGAADGKKYTLPVSSKFETKFYSGAKEELFIDLAKCLRESDNQYLKKFVLVLMHEDAEIDKVTIMPDKILLQRSLKYDPYDDYNPQLGDSEVHTIVNGLVKEVSEDDTE